MCFEEICKVTFVGLVVRALVGEEHTTGARVVVLTDPEHHLATSCQVAVAILLVTRIDYHIPGVTFCIENFYQDSIFRNG